MYEVLLYVFVGSAVLALVFTLVPFVPLGKLYKISKPNHLTIAGRFYNSFNQLQWDVGLGFRLWRNPELIRSADPRQRQYLVSIQRWGMVGTLAWITVAVVCILALISIVKVVG